MGEFPIVNYRLIYLVSSEDNPTYEKFKTSINKKEISEQLESKNIKVGGNIDTDKKKFQLQLFDFNMQPIKVFNDFNDEVMKEILKTYSDPKSPQKSQKGGKTSYKQKYQKYKTKYNSMKNIITRLY